MSPAVGDTFTLKADVKSFVKKGLVYAVAGEVVTVISISNPTAVVESEKGVKMPILIKELKHINMQASEEFTKTIDEHLQETAKNDELFAETLKKPAKNLKDCVTYILNQVKASGNNGFADAEIFGMAKHYYDEDDVKVGSPVSGRVVVNHTLEAKVKESFAPPLNAEPKPKKVAKTKVFVNQPSLL